MWIYAKRLFQKIFYFTLKKYNFFSCKHKVYIIMSFKSHIKKIKHSSNIYIVNFDMS